MKDNLFDKPITKQFEFDEDVASVFDDMLRRSVPHYKEVLDLTTAFALKYLEDGDRVYDLGCSTASTLINIAKNADCDLELIGIDNSCAMLKRASQKAKAFGVDIKFIEDDIFNVQLQNSKNFYLKLYTTVYKTSTKRKTY